MTLNEYIAELVQWAEENDAGELPVYSDKWEPAVAGPPLMMRDRLWRHHGRRIRGISIVNGSYIPAKNGSTVPLSDGDVVIVYGPSSDRAAAVEEWNRAVIRSYEDGAS